MLLTKFTTIFILFIYYVFAEQDDKHENNGLYVSDFNFRTNFQSTRTGFYGIPSLNPGFLATNGITGIYGINPEGSCPV